MTRATVRKARKFHRCASCEMPISPGERYLWHVASPNHQDLNNTRWWRYPECGSCAKRYGRAIAA